MYFPKKYLVATGGGASIRTVKGAGNSTEIDYRSILTQSPNAIFISNPSGRLVMVNNGMIKLCGFTKDELLKININKLLTGYSDEGKQVKKIKPGKSSPVVIGKVMMKNGGKLIDVELTATLFKNGNMLGFLKDVTESRKSRQLLFENEQRLIKAEKMGNMGHGFYNLAKQAMNISEGLYRIFGVKAKNFSHTIDGLISTVYPDDYNIMYKGFDTLIAQGVSEVELRIMQPSGNVRNVLFKTEITKDKNGLLQNSFTTAIDVTEQKKAYAEKQSLLQRYEQTINTALAGFILSDAQGNILQVNPAYLKLTGYSRAGLLKKNMHDIEVSDGKKHKAKSNIPVRFETWHRKKNNDIIELEVSQSIMQGIDGPLIASFIYDITQKKKAQQQIENHNKKLRQLTNHLQRIREEERRRIGREIHDDLGQQLTAIKMDIAWIDKKIPAEELLLKQKINNIISLLDGSNLSVRRILHELKPSILDEYGLPDAIELLAQQFTSNTGVPVSVSINRKIAGLCEETITCIFRITQESLTNITKYAKASQVQISVGIGRKKVTALIEDDGIGFDPVVLEGKDSFGLWGIQERVTALGGEFNIKSNIGKGTSVKVVLPVHIKL